MDFFFLKFNKKIVGVLNNKKNILDLNKKSKYVILNNKKYNIDKQWLYKSQFDRKAYYFIDIEDDINVFVTKYKEYDIVKFYSYIRTLTEALEYKKFIRRYSPITALSAIDPKLEDLKNEIYKVVKFEVDSADSIDGTIDYLIDMLNDELKLTKPTEYKKLSDIQGFLSKLKDMKLVLLRESKRK